MMQSLLHLAARLFIWIIGVGPVMLELRRVTAAKQARDSILVAIGTMQEIDNGDGGEGIEARGIGFGEYLLPECECGCEDGDDE